MVHCVDGPAGNPWVRDTQAGDLPAGAGAGAPEQAPHALPKNLGEASPAPRPIRSVDRAGPVAGPDHHHTLDTPENGEQTAGRSTERQPSFRTSRSAAVGLRFRRRRTAAPRCADIRRAPTPFRPGVPSLHVPPPGGVRSAFPPYLALPTVPSSGRCKITLPQPQRHGKKNMRPFLSELILVVTRAEPRSLDASPRSRLSILPYNTRVPTRLGLTRPGACR